MESLSKSYTDALIKSTNKKIERREKYCFVCIHQGEMEQALKLIHPGFAISNAKFTERSSEIVYTAPIQKSQAVVAVFSSITPYKTRECGEDALRVVLVDSISQRMICGTKRVNRTTGWEIRLKERVIDLAKSVSKYQCNCGGFFIEKKSGVGKKFFGCSCYPACKNTKNEL